MDDRAKYSVLSLLHQNQSPAEIADKLNVSYPAVLKLRREFEEAKDNNTVHELLNSYRVILPEVAEALSDLPEMAEQVEEFQKAITGLDQLSEGLQKTAALINNRVKTMIGIVDSASELEYLTDIICKLQTSFINKNMTQVNVQNNFGNDTPKYTQFLGDKPSD